MRSPCNENRESCPYMPSDCFSDTHHVMWPRSDYRTKVEREFRELPENKVQLCRDVHELIHLEEEPPIKPSREEMMGAIALEREVA